MAIRKPKRVYGASGHPMIEAAPLGIAFLIGTVGSILFKVMPLHPIFGAAFAGLVLIAYAVYAYFATALRLDAETIGDNCYYLGFLFTLTSLAVTLYFVIEAPSASRADLIPEIIAGFGVALSSTIFGVFLRVFMMQFKVDMDSRERRERQELNEASRRFRTELGMSVDQIKTFAVESVQHNVERERKMREAFDKLLSDMQDELLKSAQEFGPALRESVRMQTEASLTMVTTAVNDSSALAAAAIKQAMAQMGAVASELSTQNNDAASRIRESMGLLVTSAEALSRGSAETMGQIGRTQEAASAMTAAITREVSEGTTEMTKAMRSARERLENGAQTFANVTLRAGEMFGQSGERVGRSLDETARQVGDAGQRLVERINDLQAQTEAAEADQPSRGRWGLKR